MLKIPDWLAPDIWRGSLVSYASFASLDRKQWNPYLWLTDLANRILKPISEGNARIIVNAPPRHGKSELISHWLPTWFIDNWPRKQIILSSYGGEFAGEWGKKVRDEFAMNAHCIAKLRTDSRATESWQTTEGGGMKTAGVGGPITGRGADLCFPAGTLIVTEYGEVPIQHLINLENKPRVLSYDHECGKMVWKKIINTSWRKTYELLTEIKTTGGNKIRSTREHPFYNDKREYREAGDLLRGDRIFVAKKITVKQVLRDLWASQDYSRDVAPRLLFQGAKIGSFFKMPALCKNIFSAALRIRKAIATRACRFLLLFGMQSKTSRDKEYTAANLFPLWKDKEEGKQILFDRLSEGTRNPKTTSKQAMCFLWGRIYALFKPFFVLFNTMQKPDALETDKGKEQSEFQGWKKLFRSLSCHEKIYSRTGQESMCGLSENKFPKTDPKQNTRNIKRVESASYRQESTEQSSRKSDNALLEMPCGSSQIDLDTIQETRHISVGEVEVYDLEVEDSHNFFANGFLVHNCLIDDPHKNWEEAMSPIARERIIEWLNSTLYTRLEPNASIIVIQTRWHERDLTGYLTNEHSDPWQLIRYPALAEDDNDILGRKEGAALCPDRFSTERLNEIKKVVGSHVFAGLYQQRPAPLMGGIVKRDWFKFWTELPTNTDEWIQSWDLTFKATGTSYAVGQVWCRAKGNFYLVDQIRTKMDFLEQLRQLAVMTRRWPQALTKLIEDAADAQAVKTTLEEMVPGIVLVRARGSKEARLAAVVGAIESGNVYLPANATWLDEFLAEITTFPGTVNDDQVDAMTLALDRLIQKTYDTDIRLPDLGRRANPWETTIAEIN